MIVVLVVILAAYLAGNFYVFLRGWQAVAHCSPYLQWTFSICFWVSTLSFVAVMLMRNSKFAATGWAHVLFEYGTAWLVFTLYMVMALALFDILKLCHLPFRYPFLTSLLLTLSVLTYGFYQYWHPVIHTVDLKFDKKVVCTNDSLKIVMVSDLHLGMGTAETLLKKYVSMINDQQPDLILICGDLIDNSIVPVKGKQMNKTLEQLNAKMGIYMAPGNHEYISGINGCVNFLKQTNIQLLKDSVVTLPNGVRLAGRDDKSNPYRKSLAQLLENEHDKILIVMDHQPNELQQAADNGVVLLLCGHTHHGQIWPLSALTNKLFEVSHGYAKKENTHIYVSSGLALWGPPFRIGTHSELTVFNVSWIK